MFVIIYTQLLQSSFDIIYNDDLEVLFQSYRGIWTNFTEAYHGRFLLNLFVTFLGVKIPLLFGIHPCEWIKTGACIVKSVLIFIICFQISSNLFVFSNSKNKSFVNIFYTIISVLLLYFLYQNTFKGTYESVMYTALYGFTFPFVLYFLFWGNIFKDYTENSLPNDKKRLIYLSVLSFFVGYSSEFFAFSTITSLTFFLIYILIKDKENIKRYLTIYISNLAGFSLYTLLPGFHNTCDEKVFITSCSSINELLKWFNDALLSIKTTFISDFWIPLLIILLLSIVVCFVNFENKNKKLSVTFFYFLGIMAFAFSMLLVKRHLDSAYSEDDYIYLLHFDIIQQIKIGWFFFIYALVSMLSNKKILFNSLIITLIILVLPFTLSNFANGYKLFVKNAKEFYINKYANLGQGMAAERYKLEYIIVNRKNNGDKLYCLQDNIVHTRLFNDTYYFNEVYGFYSVNCDDGITFYSLDDYYKSFLDDGYAPIDEADINRPDFGKLMKIRRKN